MNKTRPYNKDSWNTIENVAALPEIKREDMIEYVLDYICTCSEKSFNFIALHLR